MIPISVIVPIYNMENMMRKCLDSILVQTFTDYECLMIDDGSKDGSPAICDEYAAKDPRFKAFHKPNGGLSDARNYGLAHAQGKYTIFFDPDDWVDEDCLKDLYAKLQETDADMVMCDLYYNDPYRQSYCKQEPTSLNHYDVLKDLITGKVFGFTVTKLIRRSLYKQFDLQYPKGMYGSEDTYTMCALLKNEISIAYLPKAYYHYMHQGDETQSRRYNEETYRMDLRLRERISVLLEDTPYRYLCWKYMSSYVIYRAFMYGKNTFTNQTFRQNFQQYYKLVKDICSPSYMRSFYFASTHGWYHQARAFYSLLYNSKQVIKRIKHKFQ